MSSISQDWQEIPQQQSKEQQFQANIQSDNIHINSNTYYGMSNIMDNLKVPDENEVGEECAQSCVNNNTASSPPCNSNKKTTVGSIVCVSPPKEQEDDELVSVILTFRYSSSYDALYTDVPQKSEDGTYVAVYLLDDVPASTVYDLLTAAASEGAHDVKERLASTLKNADQMLKDISSVDPESVVFNWECCSGCGGESFPHPAQTSVNLISYLLSKGFMVMCSDFSLKALINKWDAQKLGANPFKQMAQTFSGSVTLKFDPQRLKTFEDSAQLQVLGELCESGEASVHALGGTIIFAVDSSVTSLSHPKDCEVSWNTIEVLTIATELGGVKPEEITKNKSEISSIDRYSGLAGHCILTYGPSNGRLLVSCPHWIEISKLDSVDSERLQEVAKERFGEAFCAQMMVEEEELGGNECLKREYRQKMAKTFIQQSAPGKYKKASILKKK